MDRIAPTKRPEGKNAGTQNWRELLFLHWRVPTEAMRAVVPAPLSLDLWDGAAWIGLVPFLMRDVRPSWWPSAFAFNFLECNLRTYVHVDGVPGVYFFSLEASSFLAVKAARIGWGLPYHHAEMAHRRDGQSAHFETTRRADGTRFAVDYDVGEPLGPSAPGTLEHFFLERYLLYSEKGGRLVRGQVHHPPYPAHAATVRSWEDGLVPAIGLPALEGEPELVHFAPGVDVEVFDPRPLE